MNDNKHSNICKHNNEIMPHFGDPEYWKRYFAEQAQDPFHSEEFLQDFQGIKRPIMAQLKKKSKMLFVSKTLQHQCCLLISFYLSY